MHPSAELPNMQDLFAEISNQHAAIRETSLGRVAATGQTIGIEC
jgi:hypothetical protein